MQYDQVQFTKPEQVLSGMGLDLGKTEQALAELREKGLAWTGTCQLARERALPERCLEKGMKSCRVP